MNFLKEFRVIIKSVVIMSDKLIRGTASDIRFVGVDATQVVAKATKLHNLSITCSVALGRALMAGLLISTDLKSQKNSLTLKIDGDGPVGNIIVVAGKDGTIKGSIKNASIEVPFSNGKGFDIAKAIGKGTLTIIKDEGLKTPYHGVAELQTSEIAQDIAYWFAQSMQISSIVVLGVMVNKDGLIRQAGGFMIQLMPFAKEKTIALLEKRMEKFPNLTDLMDMNYSIEEILKKFIIEDPKVLNTMPVKYNCGCSGDRFRAGIALLGKKEIEKILKEKGNIKATCHFCGKIYEYKKNDLR